MTRTSVGLEWFYRGAVNASGERCTPLSMDDTPANKRVGKYLARAVLAVFCDHVDEAGESWVGADTIAAQVPTDERRARTALQLWRDAGVLVDTGKRAGRTGRAVVWGIAAELWAPGTSRRRVDPGASPPVELVGDPGASPRGERLDPGASPPVDPGANARACPPRTRTPTTTSNSPGLVLARDESVEDSESAGERPDLERVRAILETNGAPRRLTGRRRSTIDEPRPVGEALDGVVAEAARPRTREPDVDLADIAGVEARLNALGGLALGELLDRIDTAGGVAAQGAHGWHYSP